LLLEFIDPKTNSTKIRRVDLSDAFLKYKTAVNTAITSSGKNQTPPPTFKEAIPSTTASEIIINHNLNASRHTRLVALISRMFAVLSKYSDLSSRYSQYTSNPIVCAHAMPMTNCGAAKSNDLSGGKLLFTTASYDRTAKIFSINAASRSIVPIVLDGHRNVVYCEAFNDPFGDKIATGSFDKTAKLWSTETGQCYHTFESHSKQIVTVAFDKTSSSMLATGSMDDTCVLWDIRSGTEITKLKGHSSEVIAVEFGSSGIHLATGSFDSTVNIWDLRALTPSSLSQIETSVAYKSPSNNILHTCIGHRAEITAMHFTGVMQNRIVTASMDGTAKIWDLLNGKCLNTFNGHSAEVLDIAVNPAGDRLATVSADATARVYDISPASSNLDIGDDYKMMFELKGHSDEISKVVFNSHGDRILTAGRDKCAKMWSISSGACLQMKFFHVHLVIMMTGL
ncbi:protein with putative role during mitosis, partial [Physocladia obscura]